MKIINRFILVLSLLLSLAVEARAQTAPPTLPTFFQSMQSYFTEFNTNYDFAAVKFSASTGYKQVTGEPAASYADVEYNVAKNFFIVGELQYFGLGSSVNQFKGGVGYNVLTHYDTQLSLRVYGGVDTVRHTGIVEPELVARKKLTLNTYAEIGLSFPVYFKGGGTTNPTFKVGAGFTF